MRPRILFLLAWMLVAQGYSNADPPKEREPKPSAAVRLTRLRVSSNHRYLEDSNGRPFFLVGDCPQNLPLKLPVAEFDRFMAECASKGFNWLWICVDGQNSGGPTANPPVDKQGNRMMMVGWDIGALNENYFTTIDAIVKAAERHRHYCAFTPLSECQWSQANIDKNGAENWKRYDPPHHRTKRSDLPCPVCGWIPFSLNAWKCKECSLGQLPNGMGLS